MPDPHIHCRYDALIPAAELKALIHQRNPNRHKQKQIDLIGHVIERLGWRHPIVVSNLSRQAVAGNGRIYAAVAKGWSVAPVVYQDFESEEAEKAFLLSDNRLAELSDRDDAAVAALLREIGEGGLDTMLSGYDGASMDKLLARLGDGDAATDMSDAAPDPNAALAEKWGTASGQVWLLGEHRLVIGDASVAETWEALMSGGHGSLVFTDPPYGVDYEDTKGRSIEGDDLQRDDLAGFLTRTLGLACRLTIPEAPFYVWHASSTREDFSYALKSVGLVERQYLTWVKEAFVLGHEDYHWQTEHAFYAAKQGARPRWFGDRTQSTSWRIEGTASADAGVVPGKEGVLITDGSGRQILVKEPPAKVAGKVRHFRVPAGEKLTLLPQDGTTAWCVSRDPVTEYVHPNQKPVALAGKALRLSSQPGDVIVDMFAGSGSTMMACEDMGRKARCIEIHPYFAAAAIERWHLRTNRQPQKAA
jgi:DNA modification methylase